MGAGAAVVWATPLVEFYGPRVTRVSEFYVMVSEGIGEEKEGVGDEEGAHAGRDAMH